MVKIWALLLVISPKNDQKLIFGAWMWEKGCEPLDAKSEVIWGVVSFLSQKNLCAPFFPFLATPPSFFSWTPPLLPIAAALHTLHFFLLPLNLLHAARIKKGRSKLDWRWREDQGDVLSQSLLADFLGETLGKNGILVPPYN
jgi:hypothetical protein